ncbi:MAG TPA: hypothetical protein VN655_10545 [Pseudolabrys sp.]|jgi:hypothetical protein|nr:hypothetical protein [Pseudolabrys sp.]
MYLLGFPLLLITFAVYNIVAFLMPGLSWTGALFSVHMVSGADWAMSAGDLLITLAILLLAGEVIKSTRIGIRTIVDHSLSLVVFLGMLVEFLLVKQTATGTFFILLVISFVDVIAGFAVTLRSAQRDLTVEGVGGHLPT